MFADQSNAQIRSELGQRVRDHRKTRRLSQQALAERAGLSRPTLSGLERGREVSVDSLLSVLRALDLLDNLDAALAAPAPSPIDALAPRRRRTPGGTPDTWAWGDER